MRLPLRRGRAATADPTAEILSGYQSLPKVIGGAAILLALGWLVAKGAGDLRQFATVSLNGITLAALYFVVASGFTLIFGLMRIVNMAHGSLYLLGGYLAFEIQKGWFEKESAGGLENLSLSSPSGGASEYDLLGWLVPILLAAICIGVVGVLIQQLFLRWNQGQDLRQALITIAISVIMADQMLAHFGGIAKDIKTPVDWPESVTIFGVQYGFFRLVIVTGAALVIGVGLWWLIKRTRFGLVVRAGVDDREMVSALGINIPVVFAVAFFLGAMLAGIGGGLGGTMIALEPGEDASFLLSSLIVVIIGGMGSLGGAAIGAILLGLVDAYADVYLVFGDTDLTNYSILVTFALLVLVLAIRPLGLFGRPA